LKGGEGGDRDRGESERKAKEMKKDGKRERWRETREKGEVRSRQERGWGGGGGEI
jgi:hypothetical protein